MTATALLVAVAVLDVVLVTQPHRGTDRRRARRLVGRATATPPPRRGRPWAQRAVGTPLARRMVRLVESARRPAADRAYERELPAVLEALARGLRSGTPLPAALRAAATSGPGAVADDLASAAADLEQGVASSEVFGRWLSRRPLAGVRLAVAALVVGTELGGSRARAVDRVAAGLRDRAAAAREVWALASQARLSAIVIVVAPAAFALLGLSGNRDMGAFLFATPLGWACLAGGFGLDALAAAWMMRIVRAAA